MKKKYEVYSIGTKVWAISCWYSDNKETDHCAIYEAVISEIIIRYDNKNNSEIIEYWLKTPDGKTWGQEISEKYVSTSFNDLVNMMKEIWIKNSNEHGDPDE